MKESYLTERDKQLSKPLIGAGLILFLVVVRVLSFLLVSAAEQDSPALLVFAGVILAGALWFWIWKRKGRPGVVSERDERCVAMGWSDFLKGHRRVSSADRLRQSLFDAAKASDERAFDRICRDNRDRVLQEFETWQTVPKVLRADPEAVARYAQGLTAVANWFARNGAPQLLEALQGAGGHNPIVSWENQFGEADMLKNEGRFAEAIAILNGLADEMGECQGSGVDRYLPMVHGSVGECLFRIGQLDSAYESTRSALGGCVRSGDMEGIIVYCENLAEICKKRSEEARLRIG